MDWDGSRVLDNRPVQLMIKEALHIKDLRLNSDRGYDLLGWIANINKLGAGPTAPAYFKHVGTSTSTTTTNHMVIE